MRLALAGVDYIFGCHHCSVPNAVYVVCRAKEDIVGVRLV